MPSKIKVKSIKFPPGGFPTKNWAPWMHEAYEMTLQVRCGAKPLASVECEASLAKVQRFMRLLALRGPVNGGHRTVLMYTIPQPSTGTVELVLTLWHELYEIYSMLPDVPQGGMRAAFEGFLFGYSAEAIASYLKGMKERGMWYGRPMWTPGDPEQVIGRMLRKRPGVPMAKLLGGSKKRGP